ncbi:helix-turn-helix domain-containing protein [uncultured Clostridium sp.]|jgi:excisionase family DNA binding protein|uniref:helix-turn-helix domain-containing protein n=1 Tax=uncultured Clostridium sp. TaxID=59620 RepID=UPI00261455EC|nr:helix-turn-helix domain-containing protein [uncultured Clostridium sp.]
MRREDLKEILTVNEVAAYLGISRAHAYELFKQERFRVIRMGKCIRIPRHSFLNWVDNNEK